MVRSPNGDIYFFDIVARVLQDPLAPSLFIICLDYVLRTLIDLIKENDFTLKKTRSRRYHAETITDIDYADNRALLAKPPAKTELQLHSLKPTVTVSILLNKCTTWMLTRIVKKKTKKLHGNLIRTVLKKILETTLHKTAPVRPLTSYFKNHQSKTKNTSGILMENQGRYHKRCSSMDPYIWTRQF